MRDRRYRNPEEDTEKRIGADVRNILSGRDVRGGENGDASRSRAGSGENGDASRSRAGSRENGDTSRAYRGRVEQEQGPYVYPGGEDHGIGSRVYTGRGNGGYNSRTDDRTRRYGDPEMTANLRDAYAYDLAMNGYRQESPDPDEERKKKKKRARGPYLFISWAFAILFFLLIFQMFYFNIYMNDEISDSPYNRRQSSASSTVIRGDIVSSDGQVLATTEVDDEGNETRVYPYYNEYAHVVGYDTNGRAGLESAENYELRTTHISLLQQIANDFTGQKSAGDTVVTTLDSRIQDAAYSALGSYNGAIIVMRPQTGEIVAMVAKPDFDPNTISDIWDELVSDSSNSQLVNRATQGLYAPGSTFKIVTSLAYYREHHSISDFSYNCTGFFEIGTITVHCYGGAAHGEENFASAFAHSCNTAFSQIGLDVGTSRLTDTAEDLLIGSRLPCDITSSKSRWYLTDDSGDAELVQTAFGQGKTLVTPYQMLLIASAVANDGVLMKPYLVDHTETADGTYLNTSKQSTYKKLMDTDEAELLQDLMRAVVTEGSASALSDRAYETAGKTGSAEYTRSDGSTGTHSWFVGYTGGDDPDYAIAVLAEDGGAGSSTAVPMVGQVLDVCESLDASV